MYLLRLQEYDVKKSKETTQAITINAEEICTYKAYVYKDKFPVTGIVLKNKEEHYVKESVSELDKLLEGLAHILYSKT